MGIILGIYERSNEVNYWDISVATKNICHLHICVVFNFQVDIYTEDYYVGCKYYITVTAQKLHFDDISHTNYWKCVCDKS